MVAGSHGCCIRQKRGAQPWKTDGKSAVTAKLTVSEDRHTSASRRPGDDENEIEGCYCYGKKGFDVRNNSIWGAAKSLCEAVRVRTTLDMRTKQNAPYNV